MDIRVRPAEYADVEPLRELYRHEAACQIVHDSILPRRWADPYLIELNGRVVGFGAVWNRIYPGRLFEFYAFPHVRDASREIFQTLLNVSQATHLEAQSNMPHMLAMLNNFGIDIATENILFDDAVTTHIECPGVLFRSAEPVDWPPEKRAEPPGDWVLETGGDIVAWGGFLCHYNPPYGDIYMEVDEHARRRGYGSYLVQELKRICYEAGKKPAARCNPENAASRRTLEKAGLHPCGHLLAGKVR